MVRCGLLIIRRQPGPGGRRAPSPDSISDASRCRTRGSSGTVVFNWVVQGIRLSELSIPSSF
jgi:hypothetical protein